MSIKEVVVRGVAFMYYHIDRLFRRKRDAEETGDAIRMSIEKGRREGLIMKEPITKELITKDSTAEKVCIGIDNSGAPIYRRIAQSTLNIAGDVYDDGV